MNLKASYTYLPEGFFVSAPANIISPASDFLLAVLNSKLADYYIRKLGVTRNGGYFEYKPMFVEKLPVPKENPEIFKDYIKNGKLLVSEDEIDDAVFNLYGLNEEEKKYILNH